MNITAGIGATANRVADVPAESIWLRIGSAAVMAPAAIALVWFGGWFFVALVIAAGLLMVREWIQLCGGNANQAMTVQGIVVIAAGMLAGQGLFAAALAVVAAGAVVLAFLAGSGHLAGVDRRHAGLGIVYILVPLIALIWLRGDADGGRLTVIWILLVVWATDCGAYVAGRLVGGPKMAPRLSPNKTWSGLAGGMLLAGLAGAGVAAYGGRTEAVLYFALAAFLAVIGQVGDVFESSIKRRFGEKDSGSLIPGHGGVLDRLDSLLFVAPVAVGISLLSEGGVLWR